MKKILLIIIIFLGATNLYAQQQQDSVLVREIPTIKNNVFKQRQEINDLNTQLKKQVSLDNIQNEKIKNNDEKTKWILKNQRKEIDSLKRVILAIKNNIQKYSKNFSIKIEKVSSNTNSQISDLDSSLNKNIQTNANVLGTRINETDKKAETQINQLNSSLVNNRLYWIIATLIIFLFGGLVYWLLSKRISSSKTDVETQIKNTKTLLEEESIKLDSKLVKILESQLKLKQEETKTQPSISSEKADHSLALKVADEIIRIQKNLSRMDESIKGLKQLKSSIKRIQDNFAANGYELVEMLGKEYNEGMKAIVNFVQDEDFEDDKRIITRIIKPQVNYKGTMIQTAQIEVTEV